ncbi:helix-turn-helix domain-containing protein [Paenibacillus sp. LjRoot56]|uniref:helix-turn-helix domain-containing protein n=1 Tax=Paenibacillus sp. LjRoot56 TaxID=3342333 RepID=UPI003ECFA526
MINITKLVGERVRYLRKNRGLTQEQLGEIVQLPQSYIGGIERGEKNISLETLERIIYALDVHPKEMFEDFGILESRDELDKEKTIDSLKLLLKFRSLDEINIIHRLAKDVLLAIDSKNKTGHN